MRFNEREIILSNYFSTLLGLHSGILIYMSRMLIGAISPGLPDSISLEYTCANNFAGFTGEYLSLPSYVLLVCWNNAVFLLHFVTQSKSFVLSH